MPPPGFTALAGGSTPLKGLVGSALLPGVKQSPAAPQAPTGTAPQGQAFGSPVAAAPTALPPLPPHLAAKQPQQAAAIAVPGQYAAVPQVYHAGHAVLVLQHEQQTPLLNTPGHYSQPPAQPVYIQTPPQAAFYQPAGQAPQWLHPGWNQQPVGGWLQMPQGWVWQAAGAAPAYQPAPHSLQPVQQEAPEQLLAGSPRAQQQAQQLVVMAHAEGSAPVALLDSQLQPQRGSHMPVAAAGQAGPAAGSRQGPAPSSYHPPLHMPPQTPRATAAACAPGTPGTPQHAHEKPTVVLAQKLSPEAAAMGVISHTPIPPPPGFAYSRLPPVQGPMPHKHLDAAGSSSGGNDSSGSSSGGQAMPAAVSAVPESGSPAGLPGGSRLSAAAPAYVPSALRTSGAGGPARGQQAASGEEDYLSGLMCAMGFS